MPDYKAVLFDLDGTLVDTAPDFVLAVNAMRRVRQLETLAVQQVAPHVSNGAAGVTQHCLNVDQNDSSFEATRNELLDYYWQHLGDAAIPYPKLDELLNELEQRNIYWGVVTNKPLKFSQALLEKLNLLASCATLICPEHVSNTKPDPEPLQLAAQQLNVAVENCIYIGDHERDIKAGNAANMMTITAAYGYLDQHQDPLQWNSHYTAESSEKLYQMLQNLIF